MGAVRILMYHRISDAPEPDLSPYFRLNTSPKRFSEHMQFLRDGGYCVLDLCDALHSLRDGTLGPNHVVITFDDGYADFADYAFPVLARHSFTATVFLPSAFIGEQPLSFRNTPCLTWSQVKTLRTAGIRFGSHTVNHPKLVQLPWPQIEAELAQSKRELEEQLDEAVTTFAYPYAWPEGNLPYTQRFSHLIKALGYECCLTTRIGIAHKKDNLFALRRLPVNDCDDLGLLRAKLEGAYDWLALPQSLLKRKHTSPTGFEAETVASLRPDSDFQRL